MTERVTYRCEAGVAQIAMDDGKVNVMSTAMLRDLDAVSYTHLTLPTKA